MLFAQGAQDTTVQVTLITTIGLIVIGLIGVWTAKVTSGARKEAKVSSTEASQAADIAKDYAAALGAKNALIASLEDRLKFLEDQNTDLIGRVEECERRDDEHDEQKRAASLLERGYDTELAELRAELRRFTGTEEA